MCSAGRFQTGSEVGVKSSLSRCSSHALLPICIVCEQRTGAFLWAAQSQHAWLVTNRISWHPAVTPTTWRTKAQAKRKDPLRQCENTFLL